MHIAIIDDEKAHIELNSALVAEWAEKNSHRIKITPFESAESFQFAWCEDKSFDVVLLDIQMGHMDGVALAREIRAGSETAQLVFITGYPDFISEGYEVSALHYLVKPVSRSKLFEVLDRAYRNLNRTGKPVLLETDSGSVRIPAGDIVCVEAFAHYIELQTAKDVYRARLSISEAGKMLGDGFIRCHRSYLVGLKYIKRITKTGVVLDNGRTVPLSRRLYHETNQAFIRYFRGDAV